LSGRTTVTVALGQKGKPLGAIAGIVLSQSIVSRAHVRRDAAIRQPLQELPVPVGRVGRYRFWLSSLPLRKASEHVLRGHRLLTHPCCRRLYSHNHTTVVVDQVVVVIPQPCRRATLGRIGGIWIRRRYLVLLMHWFFHRVLLLHFLQILTHGVIDLCNIHQLLPWNAALLGRVGFHKTAIDR